MAHGYQWFHLARGATESRAAPPSGVLFLVRFLACPLPAWAAHPNYHPFSSAQSQAVVLRQVSYCSSDPKALLLWCQHPLRNQLSHANTELTGHLLLFRPSTVFFTRLKTTENLNFHVALVTCDRPSWKHGVVQSSWEMIRA